MKMIRVDYHFLPFKWGLMMEDTQKWYSAKHILIIVIENGKNLITWLGFGFDGKRMYSIRINCGCFEGNAVREIPSGIISVWKQLSDLINGQFRTLQTSFDCSQENRSIRKSSQISSSHRDIVLSYEQPLIFSCSLDCFSWVDVFRNIGIDFSRFSSRHLINMSFPVMKKMNVIHSCGRCLKNSPLVHLTSSIGFTHLAVVTWCTWSECWQKLKRVTIEIITYTSWINFFERMQASYLNVYKQMKKHSTLYIVTTTASSDLRFYNDVQANWLFLQCIDNKMNNVFVSLQFIWFLRSQFEKKWIWFINELYRKPSFTEHQRSQNENAAQEYFDIHFTINVMSEWNLFKIILMEWTENRVIWVWKHAVKWNYTWSMMLYSDPPSIIRSYIRFSQYRLSAFSFSLRRISEDQMWIRIRSVFSPS